MDFKIGDKVRIKNNEYSAILIDKTYTIKDIEHDTIDLGELFYTDVYYRNGRYENQIHISFLELDKEYYRKEKIEKIMNRIKNFVL